MSRILGLDPGPIKTGWAVMDGPAFVGGGVSENEVVLDWLKKDSMEVDRVALEMIASYGMPVGAEVFETCVWIGRFIQASQRPTVRIGRQPVKLFLCGSPKAKDPNVRQAILDLFPRNGGGAVPQVGTKKQPGPLFGVSSHAWPALAVALYYNEHYNHAISLPTAGRSAPRRERVHLL